MRPTRRQVVHMLAASGLAPLSGGALEGAAGKAVVQTAVQTMTASQAPGVSARLRDLRLDDAIEPALTFRPRR